MNAYLDSSVILRRLLNEPDALVGFSKIDRAFSSRITRLECYRTLDRLRLSERINDPEIASLRSAVFTVFQRIEWVSMTESVLQMAEGSFPTKIASLDAVHLSSAILAKRKYGLEIVFTSHDEELLIAAQAAGFEVLG